MTKKQDKINRQNSVPLGEYETRTVPLQFRPEVWQLIQKYGKITNQSLAHSLEGLIILQILNKETSDPDIMNANYAMSKKTIEEVILEPNNPRNYKRLCNIQANHLHTGVAELPNGKQYGILLLSRSILQLTMRLSKTALQKVVDDFLNLLTRIEE
jgi:hypothetical protein